MKITFKQAYKDFLKLWAELATTGEANKENTLTVDKWFKRGKEYESDCPACSYSRSMEK